MSVLDWAMLAAGLLLFLNAVRLSFGGERGDGDNKKRSLGCGFGLVASLVWAYSFQKLFGSWWSGFRLSVGIALILPAIAAIANPDRGRLIRALVALIVGALLAAGYVNSTLAAILGCIAVTFATINVVGGFMVTHRMLEMFKRKD